MPKSDAAGGIRSGRRFARSFSIVGSLEPRGHREELPHKVLLDARLFYARRRLAELLRAQGIAGAAT